jgi:hypothetical protein
MALKRFEKQPGEVKDFDVTFGDALDAYSDEARALDPVEIGPIPTGITLDTVEWVAATRPMKFWVSGGDEGRYTLTAWLNTEGGRRWEADIQIVVSEIR